jgi:hypothetical protein
MQTSKWDNKKPGEKGSPPLYLLYFFLNHAAFVLQVLALHTSSHSILDRGEHGGGGEGKREGRDAAHARWQSKFRTLSCPVPRFWWSILGLLERRQSCLSQHRWKKGAPSRKETRSLEHGGRDSTSIWSAAHRHALVPTDHRLIRYSLVNAPLRTHTAGDVRSFALRVPAAIPGQKFRPFATGTRRGWQLIIALIGPRLWLLAEFWASCVWPGAPLSTSNPRFGTTRGGLCRGCS